MYQNTPFKVAYQVASTCGGTGGGKFRLGAVLVSPKGHVVSKGYNSYKTHPLLSKHTEWPYLCAETCALIRYGLDNCMDHTLYVCRCGRNGGLRMAKPCEVCQWFIKEAGIKRVYYSIDDNSYGTMEI